MIVERTKLKGIKYVLWYRVDTRIEMRKHLYKTSPEKGVSKLAAWTTANSAVLDVEWFESTRGNSPVNQQKTVKERADEYAL